jgi:hypothetical protein
MKSEVAGGVAPRGREEERFEGKNRPLDKLLHSGTRDDVLYRYRVRNKKCPLSY